DGASRWSAAVAGGWAWPRRRPPLQAHALARRRAVRGAAVPGRHRRTALEWSALTVGDRSDPRGDLRGDRWSAALLGVPLHRTVRRAAEARVVRLTDAGRTRVQRTLSDARIRHHGVDTRPLRRGRADVTVEGPVPRGGKGG